MNVLILTPDRVGSTLLQRLITIYANINENYNPLTINLHELTNGLVSYHNETFNQSVIGKKQDGWGYHQTLQTITGMIDSCDHDIVSRLAHYHLKNRQDSTTDQLAFYKYLNENFYIIAARRNNLFEHAMSWCIAVEAKKLNVYSFEEKHTIYNKILSNNRRNIFTYICNASNYPIKITTGVKSVFPGDNRCFYLKTDDSLWAVGDNSYGQLADGTQIARTTPIQIATDVRTVACGNTHALFVKKDNTLWGVGLNDAGQLGLGSTSSRPALVPVKITDNVDKAAARIKCSAFIKTDGTLWIMGENGYAMFGSQGDSKTRSG